MNSKAITDRVEVVNDVADRHHHPHYIPGDAARVCTAEGAVLTVDGHRHRDPVAVVVPGPPSRDWGMAALIGGIGLPVGGLLGWIGWTLSTSSVPEVAATIAVVGIVVAALAFPAALAHAIPGPDTSVEIADSDTARVIAAAWRLWLSASPAERLLLGDVPRDCRDLAASATAADRIDDGADLDEGHVVPRWAEQASAALMTRHAVRLDLYSEMLAEAAQTIRVRRDRATTPDRVARLKAAFDAAQDDPLADRVAEQRDRLAAVRAAAADLEDPVEVADPDAHAQAWETVHDADTAMRSRA